MISSSPGKSATPPLQPSSIAVALSKPLQYMGAPNQSSTNVASLPSGHSVATRDPSGAQPYGDFAQQSQVFVPRHMHEGIKRCHRIKARWGTKSSWVMSAWRNVAVGNCAMPARATCRAGRSTPRSQQSAPRVGVWSGGQLHHPYSSTAAPTGSVSSNTAVYLARSSCRT